MVINQWLSKRAAVTDYKKVCAAYQCVLRQVTDAECVLIPAMSLAVGEWHSQPLKITSQVI